MALLLDELDEVFAPAADDLRSLAGTRLFLTGGTGFVGTWLLESLLWANERMACGISATVLTRDVARFAARAPHVRAHSNFVFVEGDVRFARDAEGAYDGVVHAATPASADINRDEPLLMLDTILEGGRAVLEMASRSGSIPFLFTSSGAVYGPQPANVATLPETYAGAPDPLSAVSAYPEGKRVAELQCALVAKASGLQPKIARLFAFVGPYLPLDRHFAVGNFIRDALAGGPIVVQGDGSTVRSYLYAGDMAAWLWAVYCRGEKLRAYNIGSARGVDMTQLAQSVAATFRPKPQIEVRGGAVVGSVRDTYVPDVSRAREELRVEETVMLEDALRRTVSFHLRAVIDRV